MVFCDIWCERKRDRALSSLDYSVFVCVCKTSIECIFSIQLGVINATMTIVAKAKKPEKPIVKKLCAIYLIFIRSSTIQALPENRKPA